MHYTREEIENNGTASYHAYYKSVKSEIQEELTRLDLIFVVIIFN